MRTRFLLRRYLVAGVIGAVCIPGVAWNSDEAAALAGDGCLACATGSIVNCSTGAHKAWTSSSDDVWKYGFGPHENCVYGSCSLSHGACDIEGDLTVTQVVEMIEAAVVTHNARGLNEILAIHAKQVAVSVQRSAIQITNCTGAVIAHLPVTPTLITALTVNTVTLVGGGHGADPE